METGGERKGQPWARGGDVPGGLGGRAGSPCVVWAHVFSQLDRKQEGARRM